MSTETPEELIGYQAVREALTQLKGAYVFARGPAQHALQDLRALEELLERASMGVPLWDALEHFRAATALCSFGNAHRKDHCRLTCVPPVGELLQGL